MMLYKGISQGATNRCYRKLLSLLLKKWKFYVIVKDLPYLTTKKSLLKCFGEFCAVKRLSFIHKRDGNYPRSALVKMESLEAAVKLKRKLSHYLDGKHIKFKKYFGVPNHLRRFRDGYFTVNFVGLFSPVKRDVDATDLLAEKAYNSLEEAFHKFGYTTIRILYEGTSQYTGNAKVVFGDGKKEDKILREAREKFNHCKITSKRVLPKNEEYGSSLLFQ